MIVNSSGENGWTFNPDPASDTAYDFSTDEATTGLGSLHVQPISNAVNGNADMFIAMLNANLPTDQFRYFSVDIKPLAQAGATPTDKQFYVNVDANLPDSQTDYDCRWDVTVGSFTLGAWDQIGFSHAQSLRVAADRADELTCPNNPGGMPAGSTISRFTINVGDPTGADTGVGAYIDNVGLATGPTWPPAENKIYDFEAPDTDADDDGLDDGIDPDVVAAALPIERSAYAKSNSQKIFTSELDKIEQLLLAGDTATALDKLTSLRRKVDGCAATSKPKADKDDWIIDCSAQTAVRDAIDQLIANLE